MQPDPLEIVYAAAAIDCDGHITLVKKDRHRADGSPVAYYQPTLGLGQIGELIPILLSDWFGGNVYHLAAVRGNRETFQWQVYSNVAYRAAEALIPYLRLKRRQAEILLEYEETISMRSGRGRMTSEQEARRAVLYTEMRGLNAGRTRGRTDWKVAA